MTTISLSIEGMSCGHCVAAVKSALEAVPGVDVLDVRIGQATLKADDNLSADAIRGAVADAGYRAEFRAG